MEERPQAAHALAALEAENGRLHARITALEREKADVEAFAAQAAHELLAPLVLTDACATTVAARLDEELHAASVRDLDALGRAAARTRLLVEMLLQDARSHGRELRANPIDLNVLLRDCLTLLAPEILSRDTDVQVAEFPEVYAEEPLISSLFTNLLLNALRYGPRQSRDDPRVRHPGVLQLAVLHPSQGPAIPVEDRERIFEPYHRGSGERRARGAGLGLTICRHIVERHGGQIGVTAADGGTNRFYFTLPAGRRDGEGR